MWPAGQMLPRPALDNDVICVRTRYGMIDWKYLPRSGNYFRLRVDVNYHKNCKLHFNYCFIKSSKSDVDITHFTKKFFVRFFSPFFSGFQETGRP